LSISHTKPADRSDVLERVLNQIMRIIPDARSEHVDSATDLRNLGGFDSIAVVQLLSWAEVEFSVSLADRDSAIESAHSAVSLADCILEYLAIT
jgi:acyl carrier protein